ncbi:MAG TPA: DUF2797 domain-containing protein, partial [Woeseiaceae bacterium]|nr:DUF2797 domain-containing protein [Woeseiaceae bacterium]
DWRRMLKGDPEPRALAESRDELLELAEPELEAIAAGFGAHVIERVTDAGEVVIDYPVSVYPEKVRALNLDKTPSVAGTLLGIKGQYLILDSGVLNVRKYGGYEMVFEA